MYFTLIALLALPLLSSAAPIPVPVEERRSLFLNLPLHKRLILFKRGLFNEALKFTDLGTPVEVGIAVANVAKGPQQACDNAKQIFTAIGEGESDGGTETIGDRAVAGMRRMLSTTGADDTMQKILSGDLNAEQMAALQSLLANPEKTLASLTAYKNLLDTQSTLQATVDNVKAIGSSSKISQEVLGTIVPIMQSIETTIDKMGDDFSVQKFDPADQVSLLDLISNSANAVNGLESLNDSFATSTTAAIKNVQASFEGLSKAVQAAADIPIGPFPTGDPVTCVA